MTMKKIFQPQLPPTPQPPPLWANRILINQMGIMLALLERTHDPVLRNTLLDAIESTKQTVRFS